MKVLLFDIKKAGDNKDYNGGFGTTFQVGHSFRAKLLSLVRSNLENFPTVSYAYVSAIFKQFNHTVKYSVNEVADSFDLLLIHASLIRFNEEIEFLKKIKLSSTGKVGVYGPIATVKPELYMDLADFVIVGEPEEAVIEIAKTGQIPQGQVKSNPVKDLDSLPFPDWSIYPVNEFSFSPILPIKPFTFVLASRGCPYSCSYCPYLVFGDYRVRKPEHVIEELIRNKKEYGIKAFYFRDPTFSAGPERIKKLAKLMIKNRLNLRWGCETRSDLLDITLLDLLYEAGLRAIKIGIESLDHETLKKHQRVPPAIAHQERIINYCKRKGIKIIAFYIIGLPGDTHQSIKSVIQYSRKLNTSFANFTICTPIPGTPFYESVIDRISDNNFNNYDNFHVVFDHDHLSAKEILDYQEKAICGYYFRLKYVYRYIMDEIRINERYKFKLIFLSF